VDVVELGADFYTVSAQKWLLGPAPTGALYVRPQRVETLGLTAVSSQSWADLWEYRPWPDARRFEAVLLRGAAVAGLTAALAFAQEVGEERFERVRLMAEYARERIGTKARVVTAPGQGSLVSFAPCKGSSEEAFERLDRASVVVRHLPGPGWLRASIGFWTNEDEIERLVAELG